MLLLYLLSCHLAFFWRVFLFEFFHQPTSQKKKEKESLYIKREPKMGDAQTVFGDTHKTGPSSMAGIRFGARKREMIALYIREGNCIHIQQQFRQQPSGRYNWIFFFFSRRNSEGCTRSWAKDDNPTKEESQFFLSSQSYTPRKYQSERAERWSSFLAPTKTSAAGFICKRSSLYLWGHIVLPPTDYVIVQL